MGLDYGSVTVGVAVSDGLLLTAQPVEVIKRKSETKLRQTLARIEALIAEYEVEKIVLGLPKNMNGTLGDRADTRQASQHHAACCPGARTSGTEPHTVPCRAACLFRQT